ncbi:MAG: ABC transporter permease [Cellulomonadaceae bacterium TMED98]|nr:MAG: ABC transporter permease [Cellulomonadaceae bacterium TMED98]CAI8303551.1 MAG: Manganese transport system membrane protein MntB [Cellulomonadaceae bacterium TMED98]
MEWLLEPFSYGFQQRALVGGILAALMASTVGTWLVLRGMSFFGDAFVHGVVPGVAAAFVLGQSPLLGAALAALVMVLAIEWVQRRTPLGVDTSIGLLFVGMLALGVVILSRLDSYAGSLTSILFGDALGVSWSDITGQLVLLGIVVVVSTVLYRPLVALSLNRDKAQLLGLHPRLAHASLLALIALAIIGSYQSVGTLLVLGLLIGPPAVASLLVRTIPRLIAVAAIIGAVSVWLGLTLSYYLGTAGSATMALIPVVLFFVVMAIRELFRLGTRAREEVA